ncbi:MAG TPA: FAD-dependent oxidoreductase, partial [Terracidiphilus sp.]
MSTTAAITQEECRIRLAAIAGEEHTSASGDILTVAAGSAEQAAQILRFANENGIPVTPFGSGSKQGWGNPVEAGIQLDLRRMNKLLEHAWQDMTCTVEAGCTWAA